MKTIQKSVSWILLAITASIFACGDDQPTGPTELEKQLQQQVQSQQQAIAELEGRIKSLGEQQQPVDRLLGEHSADLKWLKSETESIKAGLNQKEVEAPAIPQTLETRRLALVDPDGKTRLDLSLSLTGSPRLKIIDAEGDARELELSSLISTMQSPALAMLKDPAINGLLGTPGSILEGTSPTPITHRDLGALFPYIKSAADQDNTWYLRKEELHNELENVTKLSTQARIVPRYTNGVHKGFKLIGVRPGSIYRALGIRSGDVLETINGQLIDSPSRALELYEHLKTADKVVVQIDRRGTPLTMTYLIVDSLPE